MLFNFEMVIKTDNISKYRVGGSLVSEDTDKDLFNQVKDAYREVIDNEKITLQNHLIIKDDCILFVDIDIVSISNILKVLSTSLDFKIKPVVTKGCKFTPSSCEPLFKMEVHRLFE